MDEKVPTHDLLRAIRMVEKAASYYKQRLDETETTSNFKADGQGQIVLKIKNGEKNQKYQLAVWFKYKETGRCVTIGSMVKPYTTFGELVTAIQEALDSDIV